MSTDWRSARIAMLMATLERHRDNIAKLEERKAKYGSLDVPLWLENELADERRMAKAVEDQIEHLATGGEDPLDRLFREATRVRLEGEIGRALQLYKQIHRTYPNYPDIETHIRSTERELEKPYVDDAGKVIPKRVMQRQQERMRQGYAWVMQLRPARSPLPFLVVAGISIFIALLLALVIARCAGVL